MTEIPGIDVAVKWLLQHPFLANIVQGFLSSLGLVIFMVTFIFPKLFNLKHFSFQGLLPSILRCKK